MTIDQGRRRPSRLIVLLTGGILLLCLVASRSAPASPVTRAFPPYDGGMTFPAITGPASPEEYSWELQLGEGEQLKLIDEHSAAVYWPGGTVAMGIGATIAHDAAGSEVPTTLSVSEGDVITLTVHHRAGNPAAGGAPFVYPILAGSAPEISHEPPTVHGLVEEPEVTSADCLVPRLEGEKLRRARKRLRKADCEIGRVRTVKGGTARTGRVLRQSPKPGDILASGSTVRVTVGK